MRRALAIAFALPVLVTGTTLALVAWNRSAPRGPLALSDREVSLSVSRGSGDDDTRQTLSLQWHNLFETPTCDRLQAAGVPCGRRMDYPGYAVLELNGPSFAAYIRDVERANAELEQQPGREPWRQKRDVAALQGEGSRLVLVEFGRDGDALQRKYTDGTRFLILPATIGVWPSERRGEPAGRIAIRSAYGIHLPAHLAERVMPPQTAPGDDQPGARHRFRILLQYGRRFEPWVVDASQ
jgi:hypothetical protein